MELREMELLVTGLLSKRVSGFRRLFLFGLRVVPGERKVEVMEARLINFFGEPEIGFRVSVKCPENLQIETRIGDSSVRGRRRLRGYQADCYSRRLGHRRDAFEP